MADLEMNHMLEGLKEAIELSKKLRVREENFTNNKIPLKWDETLDDVITQTSEKICEEVYV